MIPLWLCVVISAVSFVLALKLGHFAGGFQQSLRVARFLSDIVEIAKKDQDMAIRKIEKMLDIYDEKP